MTILKKAEIIADILDKIYPEKIEFIQFENNYQLLITVILTAQTTDKQVMKISPKLFKKYPCPDLLASAQQKDVEEIIRSTGFYKAKASNIIKTASILVEKYEGKVPKNMEELLQFPGIGRKSANVVLGTVFSQPAIIVDTHFKRVVFRLGLTDNTDPEKIEYDIKKLLQDNKQYRFSMTINYHGRSVCLSRRPDCLNCRLYNYCSYYGHLYKL